MRLLGIKIKDFPIVVALENNVKNKEFDKFKFENKIEENFLKEFLVKLSKNQV